MPNRETIEAKLRIEAYLANASNRDYQESLLKKIKFNAVEICELMNIPLIPIDSSEEQNDMQIQIQSEKNDMQLTSEQNRTDDAAKERSGSVRFPLKMRTPIKRKAAARGRVEGNCKKPRVPIAEEFNHQDKLTTLLTDIDVTFPTDLDDEIEKKTNETGIVISTY